MNRSVEIRFDFQNVSLDDLFLSLVGLPASLKPTHFNVGENERRVPLTASPTIPKALQGKNLGYFLYGPGLVYDTSPGAKGAISLTCDLESPLERVEDLLTQLAMLRPLYAYAAAPEERLARNRVCRQFGINKLEAWVGRDPHRWLPGLYWLNLISEELAARHDIRLDLLASASRQHRDLGNGLHLFRFYDRPEDWIDSPIFARLRTLIPRMFDIEVVKGRLPATRNFLELSQELGKW